MPGKVRLIVGISRNAVSPNRPGDLHPQRLELLCFENGEKMKVSRTGREVFSGKTLAPCTAVGFSIQNEARGWI